MKYTYACIMKYTYAHTVCGVHMYIRMCNATNKNLKLVGHSLK